MRKLLIAVSLLGAIATCVACDNTCSTGAICGSYNIVSPGPLPSPSPTPCLVGTPCAAPTPDPCLVKSLVIAFHSGAQLPSMTLGAIEQVDATAFNDGGQVPKGCDVARDPAWNALTPSTCIILGSGWDPFVKGLRVGACSISASIVSDNRTVTSSPLTIEVR